MSEVSLYVNSVFECLRQVFVEILAENGNVPPINGNPSRVSQDGLVSYTNLRIDRQVEPDLGRKRNRKRNGQKERERAIERLRDRE